METVDIPQEFTEALRETLRNAELTDVEKERIMRVNLAIAQGVPQDVAVLEAEVHKQTHTELVRLLGRDKATEHYTEKVNPRPPMTALADSDLEKRPDPGWWIDGWLQKGTIALVAGPPAVAKTFLMIHTSRALASGLPWFGHETHRARTLYVVAEGAASFKKRIRAWNGYYKHNLVRDGDVVYVESGVNLIVEQSVNELRELFREGDYDLLVLDTYSQLTAGIDENMAGPNAQVINAIRSIREVKEGATAVIVHHTDARGTKARGSTTLLANVDTLIMCKPTTDGFSMSTHASDGGKQKDGKPLQLGTIRLVDVEGTDSAALIHSSAAEVSPFWVPMLGLLEDGDWHSSLELRLVCGIEKAEGTAYDSWKAYVAGLVKGGTLDREGKAQATRYRYVKIGG